MNSHHLKILDDESMASSSLRLVSIWPDRVQLLIHLSLDASSVLITTLLALSGRVAAGYAGLTITSGKVLQIIELSNILITE